VSWHPNELVSDRDLEAYEARILTGFGEVQWEARRAKALEDWLYPRLVALGLPPHRLRTRYQPDKVFGYTASAYTDRTGVAQDNTADDLNLATLFATAGSDALFVGSTQPFRGLSFRLGDSVSGVSASLTVAAWCDAWSTLPIADGTSHSGGKTFSGGGSVTWAMPSDWVPRRVNGSDPLYWVKVTVSATPTGALCGQIACIRRSALCGPVAFRTLELIMREAPTMQDGPWAEKAEYYGQQAVEAWQLVSGHIGGEFDVETEDDVIDTEEADQTVAEASVTEGWTWGRR
jgi:hypothetical protein